MPRTTKSSKRTVKKTIKRPKATAKEMAKKSSSKATKKSDKSKKSKKTRKSSNSSNETSKSSKSSKSSKVSMKESQVKKTKTKGIAVGIDLGTTYSCVGVYRHGNITIIQNTQGNNTTPSYVSFGEERLIGDPARAQADRNPTNTIYDAKRLIGRKYSDKEVKLDAKHWPFSVSKGKNDKPMISARHKGTMKKFTAEEISSMILVKMKEIAEQRLGEPVTKAVITVPAYFNDAQRQATKDAGEIAGLEILRIVNEPTAAAIAYGLNDNKRQKDVLVFDLGGGTFDVSILTIDGGAFEVKATCGNTHLGGEDFDNKMVEYCLKDFLKKYFKGASSKTKNAVLNSDRVKRRLKSECEKAKRTLSTAATAYIIVDSLYDGNDYTTRFTRAKFEELCRDEFQKCMGPIERVLKDAYSGKTGDIKEMKKFIDDIVLVGGSTRIPKIQKMLSSFFDDKPLCKDIHPDEAVAYGASVHAFILDGGKDKKTEDIVLLDVVPMSLGIETSDKIMTILIERNTTIPCRKEKEFSTYQDNQSGVTIRVLEGERVKCDDNHLLDEFDLNGIPPMPRGVPKVKVLFDIDVNGILTVTVSETSTGSFKKVSIDRTNTGLSEQEINEKIAEADKFAEEDRIFKERVEIKNEYENYLYNVRVSVENDEMKERLGKKDYKKISEIVTSGLEWLEDNDEEEDVQVFIDQQKKVEDIIRPKLMKAYKQHMRFDDSAEPHILSRFLPNLFSQGGFTLGPTISELEDE
jgi:L1 cell adhesion molecule like protein